MLKRIGYVALVLTAVGYFAASPSMATKDFAKKEGKACITCHVKAGGKELNQLGEYYKEHKTLKGYK